MTLKKNELVFIIPMVVIPIIILLYLSLNNQIFDEPDAWYWLVYSEISKPWLANIVAGCMWFSMFVLFSFVDNKKQNPYFIASLFLLNFLSLRFFAIELKDYFMYFVGFLVLIWLKNHKVKIGRFVLNPKYVGIFMAVFYVALHSFTLVGYNPATQIHVEVKRDITAFLNVFPVLYILAYRKDFKWFGVIMILSLVFMTQKFTATGLAWLVFAIYMDFLCDENFSTKHTFSLLFLLFFCVNLVSFALNSVNANVQAFVRDCDLSSKICYVNSTDSSFGHYFAWRGFMTNDSLEFGVCHCTGLQCLVPNITCG